MTSGQRTAKEASLGDPATPLALLVDLRFVASEVVIAFLVAGNVHQFQVVHREQEPVEVFPANLPSLSVLESFS